MSIPNCKHIVAQVAQEYPDEWKAAHTGGAETEKFIRRLAYVLHSTVDVGFGLLGQYGDPTRIADDVIMYLGKGLGVDKGTGKPQSGFDVIGGAGGPNPTPQWNDVTGSGAAIWVKPEPVDSKPVDETPPPQEPVDLTPLIIKIAELNEKISVLTSVVGELIPLVDAAKFESYNAASRASEIKTLIDNLPTLKAPVYVGTLSLPGIFGGSRTITMIPKE